ncbi:MAG: flagellar export chaperone FlgN [Acidithiobacillus sp.]
MSSPAATSDTLLAEQITLLRRLLEKLQQERRTLSSGATLDLPPIAAAKSELYRAIADLEAQRQARQGSGMTLPDLAADRSELVRCILQVNAENGQIIDALGRFTQGAWKLLFATEDTLYTPNGIAGAERPGGLIGSA